METDTLIDIFEDVDLNIPVPCEHGKHFEEHIPDDPGAIRILAKPCVVCKRKARRYVICESGWADLLRRGVRCSKCGWSSKNAYDIVEYLGRI